MPLADSLQRARSEVQGLTGDLRGARREMDGLNDSARSVAETSGIIPEILLKGRGPLPPGTASGLGPRGGAVDLGAKPLAGAAGFGAPPPASIGPAGGIVSPSGQPLGRGAGGGGGGLGSERLIQAFGGVGPPTSRELLDQQCERVTWRLPARIGQTEGDVIEGWVCPWGASYVDPDSLDHPGELLGASQAGGGARGGAGRRRRQPGTGFEGTLGAGGLRESNPTAGVARGGSDARAATGGSRVTTPGERGIIDGLRDVRRAVDRLRTPDAQATIRGGA